MIPVLIYLDATHHRIGKVPADKGSVSAPAWALWTLIPFLGWLLAVDYLISRQELIRRARIYPVIVTGKRQQATCLLILAASLLSYWLIYRADIYPHHIVNIN
jgi:hypothetical protein